MPASHPNLIVCSTNIGAVYELIFAGGMIEVPAFKDCQLSSNGQNFLYSVYMYISWRLPIASYRTPLILCLRWMLEVMLMDE